WRVCTWRVSAGSSSSRGTDVEIQLENQWWRGTPAPAGRTARTMVLAAGYCERTPPAPETLTKRAHKLGSGMVQPNAAKAFACVGFLESSEIPKSILDVQSSLICFHPERH